MTTDDTANGLVDRALARAPALAVPPDLIARIVREVPRLPQVPAPLGLGEGRGEGESPSLSLSMRLGPKAVALRQPFGEGARDPVPAAPEAAPRRRAWRLPVAPVLAASGLGTLAAALVAALALGPALRQSAPILTGPAGIGIAHAGPARASAPVSPVARPADALQAAAPQLAAAAPPVAAHPSAAGPRAVMAPAGAVPPGDPVAHGPAAPVPAPAPQLASGPVQGAPDQGANPLALPPAPPRSLMGPVLPQAYGYTGGIGRLPEAPGSAPVRMSGGPGPGPGPGPGGPH